jgi:predicted PurR-regulated permease PerM
MLIALFYFLKDGAKWKEMLIDLVPLSNDSNRKIAASLKRTINGMFKGYLVVGLAQGIVTTTGLYLFHVPHAALWGMLAIFASIIPPLGVGAISLSVVAYLFLVSRTGAAVGYGLWAIFFSMTIDNILNPYIVGRQISIHPLLVLFSVLGGLALMGPLGILIGPLVISFIYALMSVYKTEMKENTSI